MKKYAGFTLIEVMIALACTVGALSVITHFSMTLYATWKETAQRVQTRMSLYAALDTLRRDLERAPKDTTQWYVKNLHEIAWHDTLSSGALRFCLEEGRLERNEGSYNQQTHQWHSKATSVLAQDIKEIRFVKHANAVEVTLLTLDGSTEYALIALGVGALS